MPTDLHCPDSEQLQAFLAGTAPRTDSQTIKDHVAACDSCRSALVSLSARDGRLHQPTRPPASGPQAAAVVPRSYEREGEQPTDRASYAFLLPPVKDDEIGRLGSYRVLRLLGEGGMAFVFEAEDVALGRPVALKVIKPEVNGDDGWRRFLREARTMAAISHEHLVTIYQAGQEGAAVYFAMERLHGESLDDRLRRAPRPDLAEILRIGREIAAGLAFLHGKGLVHRDLKPANVWLEAPRGRVEILDLGLARLLEEDVSLTRSGVLLGTPAFMSPEQARSAAVDARSDLFSLGCVMYCLCTGTRPFQGETTMALLTALAVDTPRPAHEVNRRIPRALSDLVAQLLAKRPMDRPASADAVREQLERIERQPEASTPPQATPAQPVAPPPPAPPAPRQASAVTGLMTWAGEEQPVRRPQATGGRRVVVAVAFVVFAVAAFAARGPLTSFLSATAGPSGDAPQRAVYLTDLKEVGREHWPIYPPPHPNGEQPGRVIRVGGKVSPHSIFMHPPHLPGAAASLSYSLGKRFDTFRADVSFNDGPPRSRSACTFWVYGDGKLLWQSRPVWGQEDAQPCAVSVKGVDVLRIVVNCAGPPMGAHCVWVEPRVGK